MNGGVGRIYRSNNSAFKIGDVVQGYLDWAEYTRLNDSEAKHLRILENKYKIPWSAFTSILGMPGFTAYCGLKHIGQPKKGETVFISAASGAVGQVVGQLAKKEGLRVVGSAGSDEKVKFLLEELDFDAAFNYKKEKPADALPKLCPNGIDVYWENVGGETLDAVLLNANNFSRFVACGMISTYAKGDSYGVKNLMQIVSKRIRFEGFIQSDLRHLYWDDFCREIEEAVGKRQLKYKEDITVGLENGIDAFTGMLDGKNFGKAVIKVSD